MSCANSPASLGDGQMPRAGSGFPLKRSQGVERPQMDYELRIMAVDSLRLPCKTRRTGSASGKSELGGLCRRLRFQGPSHAVEGRAVVASAETPAHAPWLRDEQSSSPQTPETDLPYLLR